MRFPSLDGWLAWQETLHPNAIDLGLERVSRVAATLDLLAPAIPVITVAGTNGKGSCVTYLEAIYRQAGYRTGAYTSPHLHRYNERIRVDGAEADDASLCRAFAAVDEARGEESLTYFEFGTLAALWLFRAMAVDLMILEVGLGGRLDAVNIVDADVAVITSIGLDHQGWLGSDRDSIGREKAGIARAGRPTVCGEPDPPAGLLEALAGMGANLRLIDRDFSVREREADWDWRGRDSNRNTLPRPAMRGTHQLRNAAVAVAVVQCLLPRLAVNQAAVKAGLLRARLPGRQEVRRGRCEEVLDVAHNPQAVKELADALAARPVPGRHHVVLGMLSDKEPAEVVTLLRSLDDRWYLAGIPAERGLSAHQLRERIGNAVPPGRVSLHPDVPAALAAARAAAAEQDRIVITGSFFTVAAADAPPPIRPQD